jgi:hypothetical protein
VQKFQNLGRIQNRHRILLFKVVAFVLFAGATTAAAGEPTSAPVNPSPEAAKRVWLSDLPERNVKVGYGSFGKNGQAGFEPGSFTTQDCSCEHGLGTHADSHVEYVLGKKYRTFRATAAMSDTSKPGQRPIEFRVLGDGKQLWQSYGMHNPANAQPCLLDITGVDVLVLETRYRPGTQGDGGWAHTVWVDPFVATDAPTAAALALFAPEIFLRIEKEQEFEHRIHTLIDKQDFAELEAIIKELRAKDTHYQGLSGRELYYTELGHPDAPGDDAWKQHLAHLKNWQKASPDSPTPLIALGRAWANLAWSVRGGGYSNTVSPESWKQFDDRVETSRKFLEAATDKQPGDPEVYSRLINLAKARSWSRDETMAALEKGVKLDSHYFPMYEEMATYLLPQWHGRPGDVQRFAADMRKRLGGELGDSVYFRVACQEADQLVDDFYSKSDFRYENLLPGIRLMLRDHPEGGYYFNSACHMACLANDKELAATMLVRLDPATIWPIVWQAYGRVERWRRLIDPSNYQGEDIATLLTESGWVRGVAFLNDSHKTISGGYAEHFEVWDLAAAKEVDRFQIDSHIRNLAVDAAGSQVIVSTGEEGSPDSEATVYNLQGDHSARVLKGHSGSVVNVAVSRDGNRYGTAARDNTAKIWRRNDLDKPITLKHPEWVYDIAFSPDGKTAATSSYQGGVWLWNADSGEALGEPLVKMQNGPWQCRLCFMPDSKALITASADGTIRRWDLATRKFRQIKPDGDNIFGLAVSPDGKWLAVGRKDGRVDVLLAESMRVVHSYRGHRENTQALAFSPDSKSLVTGSDDNAIKLWPIKDIWAFRAIARQAADGAILLKSADANLYGNEIRYQTDTDAIAYWTDQQDWLDWDLQIDKPGKFEVTLTSACAKDNGGGQYVVTAGAATLNGTVHVTGDWGVFNRENIGEIEIAKPGRISIAVKAASKPGFALMNLRLIELRPERPPAGG